MLSEWPVAILLAARSGTTPPAVSWVFGYSFGTSEAQPHAGVETFDGGLIVVGDGQDYSQPTSIVKRSILLLKIDGQGKGEKQWRFGEIGYNYGKFVLQAADGTYLVGGAMTTSAGPPEVLSRVIFRLDENLRELGRLVIPNTGAMAGLRDGFMALAFGEDESTLIATGFRSGESAKSGYPDEPMFLINGGHPFVTKFKIGCTSASKPAGLSLIFDKNLSNVIPGWRSNQGMRVFFDPRENAYVVSHTLSDAVSQRNQFGMSSLDLTGEMNWQHVFPANRYGHRGHASHPYALTLGHNGIYAIGGLAVVYDSGGVEQCEGRLLGFNPRAKVVAFDSRFLSPEPSANIECYGLQTTHDGGYILACGTGVEPELHPNASQKAKTWRALVHRTDATGTVMWEHDYTDNSQHPGPGVRRGQSAGEYIVASKNGGYALLLDTAQWGSSETGGNFGVMMLEPTNRSLVGGMRVNSD